MHRFFCVYYEEFNIYVYIYIYTDENIYIHDDDDLSQLTNKNLGVLVSSKPDSYFTESKNLNR